MTERTYFAYCGCQLAQWSTFEAPWRKFVTEHLNTPGVPDETRHHMMFTLVDPPVRIPEPERTEFLRELEACQERAEARRVAEATEAAKPPVDFGAWAERIRGSR